LGFFEIGVEIKGLLKMLFAQNVTSHVDESLSSPAEDSWVIGKSRTLHDAGRVGIGLFEHVAFKETLHL
jgi:hypothetical protein